MPRCDPYDLMLDPAANGEVDRGPGMLRGICEPEQDLLFAVLLDAIRQRDRVWVEGVGGVGPFTFVNVCDVFGFDTGRLQEKLLNIFAHVSAIKRPRRMHSIGMSAQARAAHRKRQRCGSRVARGGTNDPG